MNDPVSLLRSALPGVTWPAIPGPEATTLLALQYQLERSQWLAPERLRELQYRQLETLLRHAYDTVPHYREHWRGLYDPSQPLSSAAFSRLPLMTRGDLQVHFDALKSVRLPADHGAVTETRTSGSTGSPVRLLRTGLDGLMWRAITLRDHFWHRRDFRGTLAAIRQGVTEGEVPGWGPATDLVAATGRSVLLSPQVEVDTQLDWIARHQPDYLLCYPSNLAELVRRSVERGLKGFPGLREVRTIGETLPPDLRESCRQSWDVPVTDLYSAQEVGVIALQCPDSANYHVQAETLVVEVLDERGGACGPGEVGRVVVTALHGFAMPLVRYEIGDYAEVAPACACGRGLPTLARILGRVRNMLVLADGSRFWPTFGNRTMTDVAPVRQFQFVQKSFDTIEARLVTERPLTGDEEARLRRLVQSKLPVSFEISFVYCGDIPRSAGGKYEDFISEIA